MPAPLPDELLDMLRKPSPCFVSTLMPDGSPQLTQTWVDTDGEHIVINIVEGSQKDHNMRRDPRVAVNVADAELPAHYFAVRGRVVSTTTEGGADNIEELSHKYLGKPYPNFTGKPETRVLVTIEADRVHAPFG